MIVTHATTPPVIMANTFSTRSCPLYVPKGTYAKYWTADVWGEFTDIREIETTVTKIELNEEAMNLAANRTMQLTATLTPSDATLKDIYWYSDAPTVAPVDQNGNVRGLQSGMATITAMAIDGSSAKATCHISVEYITVETLILDPSELTVEKGDLAFIKPVTTPTSNSNSSFIWSISDENVADYLSDNSGALIVIGSTDGVATITCRTTDGSNLTATCVLTVGSGGSSDTIAETLTLNPSELTLAINQSAKIMPVITPENVSNKTVEWSTSNTNVAPYRTNSDGTITVLGAADGVATITCRTTDGSNLTATCVVTVGTGAVDGIEADAVTVRGENGVIHIEGADGARVEVYNAAGVCIYSGTATEIPVPQRGLYVVKVAGRATKLAL